MIITEVVGTTVEPMTLAEARLHLLIDVDPDKNRHEADPWIVQALTAAREHAEEWTGLKLVSKQYSMQLDAFTDTIVLPRFPVTGLNGFTYTDPGLGVIAVPPAVYRVDIGFDEDENHVHQICLRGDQSWPETNGIAENITVTWTAGQCPAPVLHGIKLMLGEMYIQREASEFQVTATPNSAFRTIPVAVETLYRPYRVRLGFA